MSSEQTDQLLQVAIQAARAGGELALARRGNPGYLRWKGPRDLQAGAVLDIQARIVESIQAKFPDDTFIVEESASDSEPAVYPSAESERVWIIDPIDGSMNFNQGMPLFAISIGFRLDGRYQIGIVFDPCNDELFHATSGRGAYLNGMPIYVSKFMDGQDAYRNAFVGTDLPGTNQERNLAFHLSRFLGNEVTQLWTLGSPALGLCYVAAGRLHSYYALHLKLWDVAAASVILREAGGTLTDIMGGSWLFSQGGYLATNGVIHGEMLRAIRPRLESVNS